MSRLSVAVDRSIQSLIPVFDAVAAGGFFIHTIRLAPVAWSNTAEVHLDLGGGNNRQFDELLDRLRALPGVAPMHPVFLGQQASVDVAPRQSGSRD